MKTTRNKVHKATDAQVPKPYDGTLRISLVDRQGAMPAFHRGRVDIHRLDLTAQIPTEDQGSYLVHQIMGNQTEALIVSPDGLTAKYKYDKPVAKLRPETPRQGCFTGERQELMDTDEDTGRYWLLSSPEFRTELAQAGWMIFPEIKAFSEYDQKTLGASSTRSEMYQRTFSLSDFIKVLKLTNDTSQPQKDNTRIVDDLRELVPFGQKLSYCWRAGGSMFDSFFHMPTNYGKERTFNLRLEGVREIFRDDRFQATPDTLTRIAIVEAIICSNSEDTVPLIREYAKSEGIKLDEVVVDTSRFIIKLRDRDYGQKVAKPDTKVLLEQAKNMYSFAQKLENEEEAYARMSSAARIGAKRTRLGIGQ